MDADEEYRKSRLTKNMCVCMCMGVSVYVYAYKKRNDDGDYEMLRHPFNDVTFSEP